MEASTGDVLFADNSASVVDRLDDEAHDGSRRARARRSRRFFSAVDYHAPADRVAHRASRRRADDGPRPAPCRAPAERQRRRRDARGRDARHDERVRHGDERPGRRARPARHPLRQSGRARRRANYSSARDLAKLAIKLRSFEFFRKTTDLPSAVLRSGSHKRVVTNRNTLVHRYSFVNGVKTGHTNRAGFVLVGSARQDGVTVVSVVLGEPSERLRDTDSIALLRYGLRSYQARTLLAQGRVLGHVALRYRGGDRVAVVAGATAERRAAPRRDDAHRDQRAAARGRRPAAARHAARHGDDPARPPRCLRACRS